MPKQPITQLLLNSKYKTCTHYIAFVTQAMSNGKRIMVWRSVCPPVFFPNHKAVRSAYSV